MAFATTSPSAERRQHGVIAPPQIDDRAFRPFFRAQNPVEKLCLCGLITPHELRAAVTFRALHERANAGAGGLRAADLSAVRIDKHCGRALPEMTVAQAEALARLSQIKQALGSLYTLVELAIVEELSWAALGRRLNIDQRTARKWVAGAIAALATL